METQNGCNCDLSKLNMDMTIKECLEKLGFDPKKVRERLKDCCKNCCTD